MNAADIITEVCLVFHWTAKQALRTPALQLFTLIGRSRKMRLDEENHRFRRLCDIVYGCQTKENYEIVRAFFEIHALPELPDIPKKEEPMLAGMDALNAMTSLFGGRRV